MPHCSFKDTGGYFRTAFALAENPFIRFGAMPLPGTTPMPLAHCTIGGYFADDLKN